MSDEQEWYEAPRILGAGKMQAKTADAEELSWYVALEIRMPNGEHEVVPLETDAVEAVGRLQKEIDEGDVSDSATKIVSISHPDE